MVLVVEAVNSFQMIYWVIVFLIFNLLSSFGSTPQNNSSQTNLFGNDFMKLDPFANPLPSINPTGATGFTGSNFGIDTFNQHTTASSSMDAFNQSLGFLRCQLCCNNNFTNNNNHRCLESIVVGALIHQPHPFCIREAIHKRQLAAIRF